ncbi:MAG: ABC transporter permease [Gammaproteobacteria bacterium]|nr:ABC transporter permease [Gammaproteobacteria bacterium]
MNKVKEFFSSFFKKPSSKQIVASLLCILCGFGVGILVMLLISLLNKNLTFVNFLDGIRYLFAGPFSSSSSVTIKRNLGNMIFYTVPLILTGLSVAIAFKTGLFNIGAAGQFLMGTFGSLMVALNINCSNNRFLGVLVWILAVIVGVICGALWGVIPGLFKAIFDINEVVVCIMTNWIAANLVTWVFSTQTHLINIPEGKSAYLIKTAGMGTYTPTFGLDKILPNSYIDGGIIIAILIAIAFFIIMSKTKFGFELKACGANKHAAKYAGMNEKKNIILSMAIAGGLAACGGAFYYLNAGIEFQYGSVYSKLPDYGFNGIPAALLANCDPIGTIFSATFLRYISASGSRLQLAGFNAYISNIISSVIIYFAGFSRLFVSILSGKKKKLAEEKNKLNPELVVKDEVPKVPDNPDDENKEVTE